MWVGLPGFLLLNSSCGKGCKPLSRPGGIVDFKKITEPKPKLDSALVGIIKWWWDKYDSRSNCQNRNQLTDLENELMVTRGEGWGEGLDWELGIDMYTLLYLKRVTNKDLGTLFNVMWQTAWDGSLWERSLRENGYMYMYVWAPSPFTWSYHNIVNRLYPNTK